MSNKCINLSQQCNGVIRVFRNEHLKLIYSARLDKQLQETHYDFKRKSRNEKSKEDK